MVDDDMTSAQLQRALAENERKLVATQARLEAMYDAFWARPDVIEDARLDAWDALAADKVVGGKYPVGDPPGFATYFDNLKQRHGPRTAVGETSAPVTPSVLALRKRMGV